MEDNKKRIVELEAELEVAKLREGVLKKALQDEMAKKVPLQYYVYPYYTWPTYYPQPILNQPKEWLPDWTQEPTWTGPRWQVTLNGQEHPVVFTSDT